MTQPSQPSANSGGADSPLYLSPHFSLEEMTRSETARRLGISNLPDSKVLANLRYLCNEVLERIRKMTGEPLIVASGYRSPDVNKAVHGSVNSYHMQGLAADFDPPPGFSHDAFQKLIAVSGIKFDLLLEEKAANGDHWLHIQIAPPGKPNRRLVRDAFVDSNGTITRTTAG